MVGRTCGAIYRALSGALVMGAIAQLAVAQDMPVAVDPVSADLLLDTAARGEPIEELLENEISEEAAAELLLTARKQTHPDQLIAIRVLGAWKAESAIPVLCQNLYQTDRFVRAAAMNALAQIGPSVEPSVRRVLKSKTGVAHAECLAILIGIFQCFFK